MSLTTYRNRHSREVQHFGDMPATLVELAEALGTALPAEMTLEEAIGVIHDRLTRLEGAEVVVGTLRADAVLVSHSFLADAIIKRPASGSMTEDAIMGRPTTGSWAADAITRRAGSGSATADAVVSPVASTSITADAVTKRSQAGSMTADAVIGDGSETLHGTLGDLTLGDHTLGGMT